MKHCNTCGKLMDSHSRDDECHACRAERDALAGIPQPEPSPEPEEMPCEHCRKHPRIEGSDLCVGCQLELAYTLSHASHELSHTPPRPLPSVSSPMSLLNDLEEKRDRVAPSDVIIVGGVKSR